jgi:hypothetical protein
VQRVLGAIAIDQSHECITIDPFGQVARRATVIGKNFYVQGGNIAAYPALALGAFHPLLIEEYDIASSRLIAAAGP